MLALGMHNPSESPQPVAPAAKPDLATAARVLADLAAQAGQQAEPVPDPLCPLPQMALARGRVHEYAGPARRTLAALTAGAAQGEGPVLWLRPGWRAEGLCPQGLTPFMPDPGALIVARCARPVDVLWSMEEALRAGCVALVVAEIAEPPDLRQVRRLHLAASEGVARNRAAGRFSPAPLGVMLAHEVADSRLSGVESRWALHPLQPRGLEAPRWRLDRSLARGLPPADWVVGLDGAARRGGKTAEIPVPLRSERA